MYNWVFGFLLIFWIGQADVRGETFLQVDILCKPVFHLFSPIFSVCHSVALARRKWLVLLNQGHAKHGLNICLAACLNAFELNIQIYSVNEYIMMSGVVLTRRLDLLYEIHSAK